MHRTGNHQTCTPTMPKLTITSTIRTSRQSNIHQTTIRPTALLSNRHLTSLIIITNNTTNSSDNNLQFNGSRSPNSPSLSSRIFTQLNRSQTSPHKHQRYPNPHQRFRSTDLNVQPSQHHHAFNRHHMYNRPTNISLIRLTLSITNSYLRILKQQ